MTYWVTLADGRQGCVELVGDERPFRSEGEALGDYQLRCYAAIDAKIAVVFPGVAVRVVKSLPYPATPRWGRQSDCPPFCYTPATCAGRSSCPKNHACDD